MYVLQCVDIHVCGFEVLLLDFREFAFVNFVIKLTRELAVSFTPYLP